MGQSVVVNLVYNITILLTLALIYSVLQSSISRGHQLGAIIMGILVGGAGILIMTTAVRLSNGTIFDARTILISVSALFFGIIPGIIAGAMMMIFRAIIGGPGMYVGILTILTALLIGIVWRHYRFNRLLGRRDPFIAELYIFGLLVHINMLLCMLLLPNEILVTTIQDIFLPVIIIYPIATYFLCMVFLNQSEKYVLITKLIESEKKYRRIAENTSDIIWTTDEELNLTYVSPSVERLFGENYTVYMKRTLEEKFPPHELDLIKSFYQESLIKEQDSVCEKTRSRIIEVEHYCANGNVVWVSMNVTALRDENGRIIGLNGVTRDITERKQREKEIYNLAYRDYLTGLYNRRFFEEELSRLDVRRNLPLTIAMGDVNGLKLLNDSFGHKYGDKLLKKVAIILKESCRADDIIARYGGDEFVILLPKTDQFGTEKIVARINNRLSTEKIKGIDLSISFGCETKINESQSIQDIIRGAENRLYQNKLFESGSIRSKTIDVVMKTLYEKNNREKLHSLRVSKICEEIAIHMKLNKNYIEKIKLAGLVHDIGKIGVDENILNKPTALTGEEWYEMKKYTEIGYRILSSANEFSEIAIFVLQHQEKWDGSGYPKGMKGKEISLVARIISVADAFDAMTRERTYRKVFSISEAIEEIKQYSGIYYDPEIVKIFTESMQYQSA